jgi:mannose-6-phosphate isomerase-like protein (cupin superfamily)
MKAEFDKINLEEKFGLFTEHWSPKILAELNDSYVKVVKFVGEFIWHKHDNEDEMFFVVGGRLRMKLRDRDVLLEPGEMIVIPRGVEHMPQALEEVQAVLIEPKTTLNTGDVENERTVSEIEWI